MKNKLLLCFRPDVTKTDQDSSELANDCGFNSMSLSSNQDANISRIKSAKLEKEGSKSSARVSKTQKKILIRSFSGTVRPALFEISLKKKSKRRKPSQLAIDSKKCVSRRNDVYADTTSFQSSTTESSVSSPTSSTSSNPSPTSQKLTGKSSSMKTVFVTLNPKKQTVDKVNGSSSSSVGLLCVLTMSLGITMFYGRVCAVIFTTLCLQFFFRRRNYEMALPDSTKRNSPDIEVSTRDYRKRVIMEGMLERSNQRRTY